MNALTLFDPATLDLVLSLGLTFGLLAAAALTIAALPWTDHEIAQVDLTARRLAATPVRKLLALSRQALVRG
ncbi:MAG: hypothetical protein GXP62_11610 [Oligoflexia bacterium]|nr:hypothetical protein [Oligoflexia bacterium]